MPSNQHVEYGKRLLKAYPIYSRKRHRSEEKEPPVYNKVENFGRPVHRADQRPNENSAPDLRFFRPPTHSRCGKSE